MMFVLYLRKLIKIIRADTAPSQIAFGGCLGFLLGFPSFGFGSLFVVFLFLLLSANLGAFLFAFGSGKVLSMVLAPPIYSLGRSLLETESLKGIWTWLLNLPGLSLCGLDEYLRFGETVFALGFGAVLSVLAFLFVHPIRRAFASWAEKSPAIRKVLNNFLMRFLFGGTKKSAEERTTGAPVLRKGFAVPVLILLVSVVVFWALVGDQVTRRGLEVVSSQVTGKVVGLRNASLAFLGGALRLEEMRVTEPTPEGDPKIAEGEKITIDLSPLQLFNRRFVVDELTVDNMTYHPDTEGMPPVPPEPAPGEPVDLKKVLDWLESHQEQLGWVLDRLDGVLQRAPDVSEDPQEERLDPELKGRASYVYSQAKVPAIMIKLAGVRNLMFDWKEKDRAIAKLTRLDLTVENISSNPAIAAEPMILKAEGDYDGKEISLDGIFDVRDTAKAKGHSLAIGLRSKTFTAAKALGLKGGSGLDLTLNLAFDSGSKSLATATCSGSFAAEGISHVDFRVVGGSSRSVEVHVKGLNLAAMTGLARPSTVRLEEGDLDLEMRFGVESKSRELTGNLTVVARNLRIAPGSETTLAGLPARDICRGLNALTERQPLSLSFALGGTSSAPSVRLDEKGIGELLEQVKTGLVMAGEEALAAQVDKHLGPLRGKVGLELDKQQEKLEGEIGEELTERASSVLGGLFGRRKKNKSEDKKKDKPEQMP